MLLSQILPFALTIASIPCLTSAAIFPKDTVVQSIDAKGFKKAMKSSRISMVAFVAPWCGHCQRMAPAYSKAAGALHPLIPMYAVDCDAQENKALCAEQQIQGFPTIKLFPRGGQGPPMPYEGERTAIGFLNWATRNVPYEIKKLKTVDDIYKWAKQKETEQPRVLLLSNKAEKMPLLWKVVSSRLKHRMGFGFQYDPESKSLVELGFEKGEEPENKILIYAAGSETPNLYEGVMKSESVYDFLKSVIKGTVELKAKNVGDDEPSAESGRVVDEL